MKLLVIGKTGQLARALADAAANHPELMLEFAGRPELDLEQPGSAAAAIAASAPNLVVNAAAYTHVDQAKDEGDRAFRINAGAAGEIALAAASAGAGVIQVSTDYVFDGEGDAPYVEDAPTAPVNAYGESKLAGEAAARESNPDHLIVRTSWLVSRYGHNFIKTMLRLADDRDEVAVVDDQLGRPTAASDLAGAILRIAENWNEGPRGVLHLAGGGEPATWADVAEQVFATRRELLGTAPALRRITTADYPTPARRPQYSVLDCTRAQREFGLRLPEWRGSVAGIVRGIVS